MSSQPELVDKTDLPNSENFAQYRVISFVIGLLVVQILLYWYWFGFRLNLPWSEKPDTWGQFGDYIGGVLNPIVALCALAWLTRSVKLQERELSETRRALADSAQAQRDQLQVMRNDQKLASLSALVQAKSSMLVEAARMHNFYLDQKHMGNSAFDDSGEPLKISQIEEKLVETSLRVKVIQVDLESAIDALDKMITSEKI
jgi:hypothetical protein